MAAFGEIIGEALFDPAGAIAELGKMERKAEYNAQVNSIHQQTAGGGGDIQVQMEYLVDFYNTLSELHEELAKEIPKLRDTADRMHKQNVGGQVTGVQTAWLSMTKMLGATGSTHSLAGNLQAFDNQVVKCMAALQHNVKSYTEHEQVTVESFGRAAGTGHHKKAAKGHGAVKHGATHHAATAQPKSTSSGTGFGGHG